MDRWKCPHCGGDHGMIGDGAFCMATRAYKKIVDDGVRGTYHSTGMADYSAHTLQSPKIKNNKLVIGGREIKNPIEIKGTPKSLKILAGVFGFLAMISALPTLFGLLKLLIFFYLDEGLGEFIDVHPVYSAFILASVSTATVYLVLRCVCAKLSNRVVPAVVFCKNCHNLISDVGILGKSYAGAICWLCGKNNLALIVRKKIRKIRRGDMIIHCSNCGFVGDSVKTTLEHCECLICRESEYLIITRADDIRLDEAVRKLDAYFTKIFTNKDTIKILRLINVGLVEINAEYMEGEAEVGEWGKRYSSKTIIKWSDMSPVDCKRVDSTCFLDFHLKSRCLEVNENGSEIIVAIEDLP